MPLLSKYYHWLHGQWPAGTVEKAPEVQPDGTCNVPGVRIVGDLTGIPLLKFSADTGARAVTGFLAESNFAPSRDSSDPVLDLAIIGGGVSGISAAIEARKAGLHFRLYESAEAFSTIRNFPRKKPIFTYPTHMVPAGEMRFKGTIKEDLLTELEDQRRHHQIFPVSADIGHLSRDGSQLQLHPREGPPITARRVIIAIGRTGNFRRLNVPGEDLPKVTNRLLDPAKFAGKRVLVVGGGDSALEAAVSLVEEGAHVTLSHRTPTLTRPKLDNLEKIRRLLDLAAITVHPGSTVSAITPGDVTLTHPDKPSITLPNDAVLTLIGREAPLDFFRKSGIAIAGEWRWPQKAGLAAMLLFSLWVYHWKAWILPAFGIDPAVWWSGITAAPDTFLHTLTVSASTRSFYYSLAYCLAVSWFGWRRIKRRKTPYVRLQTTVLALIQWLPLFLLPELLLPWAGRNGWFSDPSSLAAFANTFFPATDAGPGMEREYWRAYGFILAWPLFVANWFTAQPLWGWLIVGSLQTFVLIPWMVRRWGKGAYCGWICSCGALAETMGDAHRHKMPRGPFWNKMNLTGQVFLAFAAILLALQILAWCGVPGAPAFFAFLYKGLPVDGKGLPVLNYKYLVDLLWAGVIGIAFYFHFSGRIWCRIACPLAALMHIYSRFGKFRIFAEKDKCISCNVCTSVCHQGIDVMAFASQGAPMEDPQCVRCSACVSSCPTGVLTFGRLGSTPGRIHLDTLPASPIQMAEKPL